MTIYTMDQNLLWCAARWKLFDTLSWVKLE